MILGVGGIAHFALEAEFECVGQSCTAVRSRARDRRGDGGGPVSTARPPAESPDWAPCGTTIKLGEMWEVGARLGQQGQHPCPRVGACGVMPRPEP